MSAIRITVPVTIRVDEKYCDEWCTYLKGTVKGVSFGAKIARPYTCSLFDLLIDCCLGGGPLRCAACLAAEKQTKEEV